MTTIQMIVFGAAMLLTGLAFGAMWGLNRHAALLDWLQARTILRVMAAMQSIGYEQVDIDEVIARMGERILPPYIPCPPPPVKKSVEERLTEKGIGVIYREELHEDGELMLEICLSYADKIKEAADESDGFLFKAIADRIRDEWLHKSELDFDKRPTVDITWDFDGDCKRIQVKFDLVKYNDNRL